MAPSSRCASGRKRSRMAGDLVGLAVLRLPLRDDQKPAAAYGVADGAFIDGICVHVSLPCMLDGGDMAPIAAIQFDSRRTVP